MDRAKNVLFIVIDQLRADCVFGELAEHLELPCNVGGISRNLHWQSAFNHFNCLFDNLKLFNRPSTAGAILEKSSVTNLLINSVTD